MHDCDLFVKREHITNPIINDLRLRISHQTNVHLLAFLQMSAQPILDFYLTQEVEDQDIEKLMVHVDDRRIDEIF